MRDAHFIREQRPWWPAVARLLRLLRLGCLLGVAFALGRLTASGDATPCAIPATSPPVAAAAGMQAPGDQEVSSAPASAERGRLRPTPAPPQAVTRPSGKAARLAVAPGNSGMPGQQAGDGLLPHEAGRAQAGEFAIRLQAFEIRAEARAFCQQLTRRGFRVVVNEGGQPAAAGRPYEVQLGRFATRAAAQAYRARLELASLPGEVVQAPG